MSCSSGCRLQWQVGLTVFLLGFAATSAEIVGNTVVMDADARGTAERMVRTEPGLSQKKKRSSKASNGKETMRSAHFRADGEVFTGTSARISEEVDEGDFVTLKRSDSVSATPPAREPRGMVSTWRQRAQRAATIAASATPRKDRIVFPVIDYVPEDQEVQVVKLLVGAGIIFCAYAATLVLTDATTPAGKAACAREVRRQALQDLVAEDSREGSTEGTQPPSASSDGAPAAAEASTAASSPVCTPFEATVAATRQSSEDDLPEGAAPRAHWRQFRA